MSISLKPSEHKLDFTTSPRHKSMYVDADENYYQAVDDMKETGY